MYSMNIFEQVYLQIINESFSNNPFDSLNSDDFLKAYKYNDFPEGEDIDITNKISLNYLDEINSIILSKHCIKSETNNDIHGINYLNIPKERFINVYIPKSISKIILNKNNEDLHINSEEMYFNIRIQDNILKNDFCFIIKSKPIPHTYDINIILITIFLKKYESKLLKNIFKINDHNKKIKNRNIQLILTEEISKIKFLSFDLILD